MNASSISFYDKLTADFYQYAGTLIFSLGNLGNAVSWIIFLQKSWKKNVCVFYFLISLLLDIIYLNSGMLGSILIFGFNIDLTKSNVFLCKIFKYLTLLPFALLPTVLILASIDRLLISSQNVDTRLYSSRRLACFLISISTIFWAIFFLHVIIRFDIQYFGPFVSVCLFNTMDFYMNFLDYSMLAINIGMFFLMIILSIFSFKNVRRIRSIPRRERQTIRTMRKKDFQLLRCLFAKDILYIICTLYLCIYFLYKLDPKSRPQTDSERELDRFIFNLGCLLPYISSCGNFFIFILISKGFRQSCKRLAWKIVGKDITTIREDEVNEQESKRDQRNLIVVSTIVT